MRGTRRSRGGGWCSFQIWSWDCRLHAALPVKTSRRREELTPHFSQGFSLFKISTQGKEASMPTDCRAGAQQCLPDAGGLRPYKGKAARDPSQFRASSRGRYMSPDSQCCQALKVSGILPVQSVRHPPGLYPPPSYPPPPVFCKCGI
jgi:hypothetical protein